MYRRTAKYAKRREWHPRPEVPAEDQCPAQWQPPHLRRRITIEDFHRAATEWLHNECRQPAMFEETA